MNLIWCQFKQRLCCSSVKQTKPYIKPLPSPLIIYELLQCERFQVILYGYKQSKNWTCLGIFGNNVKTVGVEQRTLPKNNQYQLVRVKNILSLVKSTKCTIHLAQRLINGMDLKRAISKLMRWRICKYIKCELKMNSLIDD